MGKFFIGERVAASGEREKPDFPFAAPTREPDFPLATVKLSFQ